MIDRLKFFINRLREKLWIRPLLMCAFSILGALFAKAIEFTPIEQHIPSVTKELVETLLQILSGSMLVIATFAVGSMVSSFASASGNATPRTFPLVVADDKSQNALSIFIGAFIFSVISIVFVKNGFYQTAGLTTLFVLTLATFAVVILTFVRWIDSIARLGRLGTTIDKAVSVTDRALQRRRCEPYLRCAPLQSHTSQGEPVFAEVVGYVQRIDVEALQKYASQCDFRIVVRATPGAFATPNRPLAHVVAGREDIGQIDPACVRKAFLIGDRRTFDDDPRFGLAVLSEIAGRALSPAVNDPGTAIDVIGSLVRLFVRWGSPLEDDEHNPARFDRIEVPALTARDLFDDAFTAIARDGAGSVEVAARLQKALETLASLDHPETREAALHHSRLALARSAEAMTLPQDIAVVRSLARFSSSDEAVVR